MNQIQIDKKPAGFFIRAIASIIDALLIMLIGWTVFFSLIGVFSLIKIPAFEEHLSAWSWKNMSSFEIQITEGIIELIIYLIYYSYVHWKWGKTLGKRIFKIRVCCSDTETPLSFKQSVIRTLSYFLSYLPFGAGFLMAAFHPNKKALHDLVAKTKVIHD